MSEIKVNSIKGVAASTAAITVNNTDGTCTANLTNRTNKNLQINGDFRVAQRGTSSTSQGYYTVDRILFGYSGQDAALTQSQGDVAAGTTPYTLGFRKTFKVTNGNQTSGAGSSDYAYIDYSFEAQDIANSGWNYNSASSFVTFSFWVKSSVAQSFKGYFITSDGTTYSYAFDTGSLSADTWTKVTKTIPGNSNLTVNNDNGKGLGWAIWPFIGTDLTDDSQSEDAWVTHNSSARTKDATSTWWTTNNATFELTGMQLEVGSVATDFEHRTFGQELLLCQRYYAVGGVITATDNAGRYHNNISLPVDMRTSPTRSVGGIENGSGATMAPNYEQGLANSKRHFYQGSVNSAISGGWFIFEAEL